jgi:hypothetical protein
MDLKMMAKCAMKTAGVTSYGYRATGRSFS